MIAAKNKKTVQGEIVLNNKAVKSKKTLTVLGTIFNQSLTWSDNLTPGKKSLLTQIKRRSAAIKRIANMVSFSFAKQLSNALLFSKLNYNIAIWGELGLQFKRKLNNIISSTARYITRNEYFGRTDTYILKQLKWMNYYELHENSVNKLTYKIINTNEQNYMKDKLIENRNVRNWAQNKCEPHDPQIGWTRVSQQNYLQS